MVISLICTDFFHSGSLIYLCWYYVSVSSFLKVRVLRELTFAESRITLIPLCYQVSLSHACCCTITNNNTARRLLAGKSVGLPHPTQPEVDTSQLPWTGVLTSIAAMITHLFLSWRSVHVLRHFPAIEPQYKVLFIDEESSHLHLLALRGHDVHGLGFYGRNSVLAARRVSYGFVHDMLTTFLQIPQIWRSQGCDNGLACLSGIPRYHHCLSSLLGLLSFADWFPRHGCCPKKSMSYDCGLGPFTDIAYLPTVDSSLHSNRAIRGTVVHRCVQAACRSTDDCI